MDAFTLMEKDHRKVEEIFKKLLKTGDEDVKKRESLFQELKNELDAHAHMEENVFYPMMEKDESTRELAMEFYGEHNEVKNMLRELEKMAHDSGVWMAKLQVLEENVNHHVDEEEHELFPKAKKLMDKEKSNEIGDEMQKSKEAFLAKLLR